MLWPQHNDNSNTLEFLVKFGRKRISLTSNSYPLDLNFSIEHELFYGEDTPRANQTSSSLPSRYIDCIKEFAKIYVEKQLDGIKDLVSQI